MNITSVEIFEEVRYILELLVAELVFLFPFVPTKKNYKKKIIPMFLIYMLGSLFYFVIINLGLPTIVGDGVVSGWYIFQALMTIIFCKTLFEIGVADSLYVITSAYVTQHVVYVLVHEALALYYWTFLVNHLLAYILVSGIACAIWYFTVYLLFTRKLRACNGALYKDNSFLISFYFIFIAVMLSSTFSAQHLFRIGDGVRDFGILWGITTCVLVLGIQYANFRSTVAAREQVVISRMLMDSAAHYRISKELIDLVNRNAHDLKHKLKALKNSKEDLKEDFINEQMAHIEEYQNLVFCDNEVLNTILAEKSLYCSSKKITFSCSINSAKLDFIDVMDLYALLGNAIDNAIECVSKFKEDSKRVISVNVSTKNSFTILQFENYSDTLGETDEDLPVTTKTEIGHGFGLKSIKYIAKKYNGNMYWANKDGIFSLQVMLPIPVMPN